MPTEKQDMRTWAETIKERFHEVMADRIAMVEKGAIDDEGFKDFIERNIKAMGKKALGIDSWGDISERCELGQAVKRQIEKTWRRMEAFGLFQEWIDEAVVKFIGENKDIMREYIFQQTELAVMNLFEESWRNSVNRYLREIGNVLGIEIARELLEKEFSVKMLEQRIEERKMEIGQPKWDFASVKKFKSLKKRRTTRAKKKGKTDREKASIQKAMYTAEDCASTYDEKLEIIECDE